MFEKKESRILLAVWGVSYSKIDDGAYVLLLKETEGERNLPIIIGETEAHSISAAVSHKITKRPVSHDVMAAMCQAFGIVLKEVYISDCVDDIFYAELIFQKGEEEITLTSRTSDAVALALRVKAPVFTTEKIMQERSLLLKEEEKTAKDSLEIMNEEELQEALNTAIKEENYEQASIIRDLIASLKKS